MDFLEKVLLQCIGPLVSAVVGTLIIGGLLSHITRKAQERRADSQLREDRIRAEHQLRIACGRSNGCYRPSTRPFKSP
jgi:hypothetical protein